MNGDSELDQTPRFAIAGIAILLILFVLISYGLAVVTFVDPAQRGIFGDMFGALNTAFSGLAFAGILVSLQQQRTALRQSQDNFRESLAAQSEATKHSLDELRLSVWQQRLVEVQTARTLFEQRLKMIEATSPLDADRVLSLKQRLHALDDQLDAILSAALDKK